MKILPIKNTDIQTIKNRKGQNMSENTGYAYFIILKDVVPDSISFSRKGTSITVPKFRRVAGSYLTCLYTGEPMLLKKQLNKMKKDGLFNGSIRTVVENLHPYKEKYLEPIERDVFSIIEREAKKSPDITINELFNNLFRNSLEEVRREQKPFMEHIRFLGEFLPDDYRLPFKQYMLVVDKKMKGEPIVRDFSLKEFKYKLNKFVSVLPQNHFTTAINELIYKLDGNKKSILTQLSEIVPFLYRKNAHTLTKEEKTLQIITEMKQLATRYGYKRIEKLCANNIKMLKQEPVFIPFSNKAFAYDLERMFDGLPATRVKKQIIETAHRLPNSMSSIDALILKFKDSDPNSIGDRLFSPALLSIEHLQPQSQGGATTVQNCALTRRGPNSKRGSENLYETLKQYPKKNQQKYVNKLTVLVKKGLVPLEDALAQIEQIETLGRISLNKSKLLKMRKQ